MREWLVKAYEEGDEEGIFNLWKAVYQKGNDRNRWLRWWHREYDQDRWLRWWHWLYKANPAGDSKIWLGWYKDKIVGHLAIIPVVMKVGDEIIMGSQAVDAMTHPDYRQQGIFKALIREALGQLNKEIKLVYGFPNKLSRPGLIKTGWFDVGVMQLMLKVFNLSNSIKMGVRNDFLSKLLVTGGLIFRFYRAQPPPVVSGLKVAQVTFFDERFDELWAKVSDRYQVMVVRNKDYLNWRYVDVPDVNYSIYIAEKGEEICGYLVLRCIKREYIKVGVIFDILAQSKKIAHHLVLKALEHFKGEKADFICCSMIASGYIKAFRKSGFIRIPIGNFCAYSPSIDLKNSSWLVQIGDSDRV